MSLVIDKEIQRKDREEKRKTKEYYNIHITIMKTIQTCLTPNATTTPKNYLIFQLPSLIFKVFP